MQNIGTWFNQYLLAEIPLFVLGIFLHLWITVSHDGINTIYMINILVPLSKSRESGIIILTHFEMIKIAVGKRCEKSDFLKAEVYMCMGGFLVVGGAVPRECSALK